MNYSLVVGGLFVVSIILFAVLANTAGIYAQQTLTNTTQVVVPPSTPSTTKLHLVKITSPIKGQQVPTGKDLTVFGIAGTATAATASAAATAIDGNTTSHCQVYVIANGVKPYQPTTATGPGGPTDYSKWNFKLTSNYTEIKQGPNNKITAKYVCSSTPAAISFYSVNVTGVGLAGQQNKSVVTNGTASGGNMGRISNSDNHGSNVDTIQHSPTATDVNSNKGSSESDGQASNDSKGDTKNIPSGGNMGRISNSDNHGSNDDTIQHSPTATDVNSNKGSSVSDGQDSNDSKGDTNNIPSANPTLHGKINELKKALIENIKKQVVRTPVS